MHTTSWMLMDRDGKVSGDPFSFITTISQRKKIRLKMLPWWS